MKPIAVDLCRQDTAMSAGPRAVSSHFAAGDARCAVEPAKHVGRPLVGPCGETGRPFLGQRGAPPSRLRPVEFPVGPVSAHQLMV
jgi:hypothetical protein